MAIDWLSLAVRTGPPVVRSNWYGMVKTFDLMFGLIKKHVWEIIVLYLALTLGELFLGRLLFMGNLPAAKLLFPLFNLGAVPLGVLDYHYKRLPNGLVFMLGLMGLVICSLIDGKSIMDSLTGAITFGGGLYLIRYFSGGNLGLGDVKLGLATGIWLGPQASVAALYISFALGGIYVLLCFLIMSVNEGVAGLWKLRKKTIPFGPFLAMGSSLGLIWGESMARIYLNLFWQTGGPAL